MESVDGGNGCENVAIPGCPPHLKLTSTSLGHFLWFFEVLLHPFPRSLIVFLFSLAYIIAMDTFVYTVI